MRKIDKLIFGLIIILAIFLRVIWLDNVPPSLSNDEISIAYDAYSVVHTLHDEHNHFLPISFQSHNTYKAPLSIYLTIPTTLLLGNNEYSARLPSAIFGVLTILILGLLIFELTGNKYLSLLTSFLLTITPWHIYTSRMILEANIALFFVVFGIWLFIKSIHTQKIWYSFLAMTSFALSMYGYHTEWIFTPILVFSLLVIFFKQLKNQKRYYLALLLFFILLTPLFLDYLQNLHTTARANTEFLLSSPKFLDQINKPGQNILQKIARIINAVIGNYSAYNDPNWLFFKGLSVPTYNDPFSVGLLMSIFLPALIFGFTQIKKYFPKYSTLIITWFLISPVVPALTIDSPNQVRDLVSVIPLTIISALGVLTIWNKWKSFWIRSIWIILLLVSFGYFWILYYHEFPIESAEGYQYGYKQIAIYIKSHYSEYNQIVIDPMFGKFHQDYGVPHLYIAYFTNLDPQKFLAERRDTPDGLFFDKYRIYGVDWGTFKPEPNTMIVLPNSNLPNGDYQKSFNVLYNITLPYSTNGFTIISKK